MHSVAGVCKVRRSARRCALCGQSRPSSRCSGTRWQHRPPSRGEVPCMCACRPLRLSRTSSRTSCWARTAHTIGGMSDSAGPNREALIVISSAMPARGSSCIEGCRARQHRLSFARHTHLACHSREEVLRLIDAACPHFTFCMLEKLWSAPGHDAFRPDCLRADPEAADSRAVRNVCAARCVTAVCVRSPSQ